MWGSARSKTFAEQRMLGLHKLCPDTPQEQELIDREIKSLDREIDKLVDELYGLTEDEILRIERG